MSGRLVSKSHWARAHGFSPAYVTKLIKTGKIRETPGGQIDPEDADKRLAATSERFRNGHTPDYEISRIPDKVFTPVAPTPRPRRTLREDETPKRLGRPPKQREDEYEPQEDDEEEDPGTGLREDELPRSTLPDQLLRARIKKEREDGLIREMERKKRQGELVDAEEVRSASQARAVAEREALLAWPRRVSADMAVELGVEERLLLQVQQKYIREFLAERSKQPLKNAPQMDLAS